MGAAERRSEILKILCRRRHETMANLASEFGVSERTIRRDVETMSLSEPIYTQSGRYGGGVYVVENYTTSHLYLTKQEGIITNYETDENADEITKLSQLNKLNSAIRYLSASLANGWQSNMHMSIVPATRVNEAGETETYYMYNDADGTSHAFYSDINGGSAYYDEDGLKLELSNYSDNYSITDSSNNLYLFSKKAAGDNYQAAGGFLEWIQDANNNVIRFSPDAYGRPQNITMTPKNGAAITQLSIGYSDAGVICYILNPTANRCVFLYYSNTYSGAIGNHTKFLRRIVFTHAASGIVEIPAGLFVTEIELRCEFGGQLTEYYVNSTSDDQQTSVANDYDDEGRLVSQTFLRDYHYKSGSTLIGDTASYSMTVGYDTDGSLKSQSFLTGNFFHNVGYSYDRLGRLSSESLWMAYADNQSTVASVSKSYTYSSASGISSLQVASVTYDYLTDTDETWSYTYDNAGRITAISINGVLQYSYEYDDLGQLVRENNLPAGETHKYMYEGNGNFRVRWSYEYTTGPIESAVGKGFDSFFYGSGDDEMIVYGGTQLQYDGAGNPTLYIANGAQADLVWTQGRRLKQVTGMKTPYMLFTYNDEGKVIKIIWYIIVFVVFFVSIAGTVETIKMFYS